MAVVFTVLMVMAGIYALFKWPIPTLAVLGVLIVIGKSGENKMAARHRRPRRHRQSLKNHLPRSSRRHSRRQQCAVVRDGIMRRGFCGRGRNLLRS